MGSACIVHVERLGHLSVQSDHVSSVNMLFVLSITFTFAYVLAVKVQQRGKLLVLCSYQICRSVLAKVLNLAFSGALFYT